MSSDVDDDHESSQLVRFENFHEYVAKQDAFLTSVLHDNVDEARRIPVSYTHLTLPTIYSV